MKPKEFLQASAGICLILIGFSAVYISYIVDRSAVEIVEGVRSLHTRIGEEMDLTRGFLAGELQATRETLVEVESDVLGGARGIATETLGVIDGLGHKVVDNATDVTDRHAGEVSSSMRELLQEYAGIPGEIREELAVLKPYLDCDANDLCWPKQANELLFAGRMMTRDTTLMVNTARRELFPQLISTSNTLARTAEVEIPRFTGSVNHIMESASRISDSVDHWSRPAWWKEAITWGSRAALPAAAVRGAFGTQKVGITEFIGAQK